MPKRSSTREDEAQAAVRIMETLADRSERASIPADVSAAAAALGRRGGLKGGPARAAKLSKERKAEIAREAAKVRWKKRGPEE